LGLSNAAGTLVGQNLGAARPDRAERSVIITGCYNMAFLGAVAIVFVLAARPIVGIFTHDPSMTLAAVECLRFVSYGYLFYAWGLVILQAFNGAGDITTPTIINLVIFWLWELPLAWLLGSPPAWGPRASSCPSPSPSRPTPWSRCWSSGAGA
jgi:Na+-driven multidrug efflux pump